MPSLSTTAVRGSLATVAGQLARFGMQAGLLVVLARLLSADDYGVSAIALAVAGLALALTDFGLSLAAVQAETLSDQQASNLFALSVGVGGLLALGLLAGAAPIAALLGDPRLVGPLRALAAVFPAYGAAAQLRASLNRSLLFSRMAGIELAALAVSAGATIGLALAGAGYWSLIVGQVVLAVVQVVLFWVMGSFRLVRPRWGHRTVPLVRFGGRTLSLQFTNYLSGNADTFLLGRFLGTVELGIYNRAFQLLAIPMEQLVSPLTRVAVPILREADGTEAWGRYVRRAQLVLAYGLLAVLAFLAAPAGAVVGTVLGPAWSESATVFRILALGGVFQALGYVYYWVFLVKDRVMRLFVYEAAGRLVMIVMIVVGAQISIEAAAWAYTAGLFLVWALVSSSLRSVDLRFADVVAVVRRPVLALGVVAGAGAVVDHLLLHAAAPLRLLAAWTAMAAVLVLLGFAVPGVGRDARVLARTARMARPAVAVAA